jgi:hypothetical protein
MRERARVTRCTAPMAPVVISMAVAFVLEYGATVAISTARAELVQPFVPRTHASPAIVRGQFRPRRLRIGHMETRPTEPAEPQIVRAVAHFGAIAAIKTMFADLSLRTAGLDGESHSESFRRRSRLLRESANLVHSQPEWGTCNPVISSLLSSSTMTTTTTTSSLKSSSTTTTSSLTSSSTAKTSTSVKTTSSTSTLPAISSLPSCGQTCFNNLIGQYSTLGSALLIRHVFAKISTFITVFETALIERVELLLLAPLLLMSPPTTPRRRQLLQESSDFEGDGF